MLEEHERATQSGHEETTVGVFREIWLADCADRLAPRTVHSYRRILQLEALTPLLPMELHEVTARKLAPIISRVTAEHGRPSGLAAFRTLSAMFGLAERWGYIELNPFRRNAGPIGSEARADRPHPDRHGTGDAGRRPGVRVAPAIRHLHGLSPGRDSGPQVERYRH